MIQVTGNFPYHPEYQATGARISVDNGAHGAIFEAVDGRIRVLEQFSTGHNPSTMLRVVVDQDDPKFVTHLSLATDAVKWRFEWRFFNTTLNSHLWVQNRGR